MAQETIAQQIKVWMVFEHQRHGSFQFTINQVRDGLNGRKGNKKTYTYSTVSTALRNGAHFIQVGKVPTNRGSGNPQALWALKSIIDKMTEPRANQGAVSNDVGSAPETKPDVIEIPAQKNPEKVRDNRDLFIGPGFHSHAATASSGNPDLQNNSAKTPDAVDGVLSGDRVRSDSAVSGSEGHRSQRKVSKKVSNMNTFTGKPIADPVERLNTAAEKVEKVMKFVTEFTAAQNKDIGEIQKAYEDACKKVSNTGADIAELLDELRTANKVILDFAEAKSIGFENGYAKGFEAGVDFAARRFHS